MVSIFIIQTTIILIIVYKCMCFRFFKQTSFTTDLYRTVNKTLKTPSSPIVSTACSAEGGIFVA